MNEILTLFDKPLLKNLASVFLLFVVVFTIVRLLQRGAGKIAKDNTTKYKTRKLISFLGYLLFVIGLMFIYNTKLLIVLVVNLRFKLFELYLVRSRT